MNNPDDPVKGFLKKNKNLKEEKIKKNKKI